MKNKPYCIKYNGKIDYFYLSGSMKELLAKMHDYLHLTKGQLYRLGGSIVRPSKNMAAKHVADR